MMNARKSKGCREKRFKTRKYQRGAIVAAVLILQMLLIVICGTQKANYHVDEYATYILANSTRGISIEVEEGRKYCGDELFHPYFTVDRDAKFDYHTVWENQSKDVHPPLYYVFIHTVCSLFPGMFSKWFGLAVNLFFFILTGILVYNTAAKIYSDNLKALITLSIWGCMAGVVNTAVFIRMYTMAGFFVTAAVYIHLQLYKEKKAGIKFFAEVFLVTTAGGLTHYYLVVFIFFLALFYLIYFLYKKRFQEAFCYIVTYVISAITALGIFPSMLDHVFGGYRGEEAFSAIGESPKFLDIFQYVQLLAKEMTGNVFVLGVLFCIAVLLIVEKVYRRGIKNVLQRLVDLPELAMVVSSFFYCLIIMRIAPYITGRYLSPVYSLVCLVEMSVIWRIKNEIKIRQNLLNLITAVVGIIIVANTWSGGLRNLFLDSRYAITTAEENKDRDVLFVYDGTAWKANSSREELIRYKSYTFIKEENLVHYAEENALDGKVLYLLNTFDQDDLIKKIENVNENVKKAVLLYEGNYSTAYLLLTQ